MLNIVACSDIHKPPQDSRPAFEKLLDNLPNGLGGEGGLPIFNAEMLVIVGDFLDRARHPLRDFIGDPTTKKEIDRLNELSKLMEVWILPGNHDAIISDYIELLGAGSKVRVTEKLYLQSEGIYFIHGWENFDIGLLWLAPIYKKIFKWFPSLAFLWDKYMKTPAKVKAEVHNPGVKYYQYAEYVYSMVTLAIRFSFRHSTRVIFGHTHQVGTYEFDNKVAVANTGDMLNDSDYLIISNGDITMHSVFVK